MENFSREIDRASQLAREAGALIMDISRTHFTVHYKGVGDPVTAADQQANDLIVAGLRHTFPNDLIVAEESALPEGRLDRGRVWYVDPLDGTREFVSGNGEFSVMIGLAIDGNACLGIVYRPDCQLLYGGVTDTAAWMEEQGKRIDLKRQSWDPSQGVRLTLSRSHRHPRMTEMANLLKAPQEIPCGSVGLKIGLIARGDADVYIEPGPFTSAWDACGPEAVIRGAGGRMTDLRGKPLVYGVGGLKNLTGLVASNGSACQDFILQTIQPIAQEILEAPHRG